MKFKVGDRAWDFELNAMVNIVAIGPIDSGGNQWYTVRSFSRLIYEKDEIHLSRPSGLYHDDRALRTEEHL